MNVRELMDRRAGLIGQARALVDGADTEGRGLNADETAQYDALMAQINDMEADIARRQALEQREAALLTSARKTAGIAGGGDADQRRRDEARAIGLYLRTADLRPLMELRAASNDTDMNITTAADGGYAVPTGHYQGIIAKRNEAALFGPLGVMPIPGKGTTVNVPIESGSANVFVSTDEVGTFDRDAPVLGTAAMTLVKFTKDVELTDELLADEDSNLVAFLDDYVGRALALTHNSALVTEVLANGTSVTLTATTADEADPAKVIYALAGEHSNGAKWLMRRATEGAYRALTGSPFLFAPVPGTLTGLNDPLWNAPVFYSSYVPAIAGGAKSMIYGDWGVVGMRQGELTFLRDPFSLAAKGKVVLHYYTRIVYKVLNAAAILYGTHPTA